MKKVWMLVSVALVIAGAAALVFANMAAREASRANGWAQAAATVERADATSVTYRYEVNGVMQRGTNPPRPNAIYDPKRRILVYVNPANPAESLIDLPPLPPSWPIAAGAIALVVGVLSAIVFWRMPATGRGRPAIHRTAAGDATGKGKRRRKPAPMSRLQPPPPVKWKRGADDETLE
jgi:hypothetical protein